MDEQECLQQLVTSQAVQTEKLTQIGQQVSELHRAIHGPQGEPEHGLPLRVDRLEQSEKRRQKLIWMLVASVVGLVVQAGGSLIGWIKP
jgi:hypothetical protein